MEVYVLFTFAKMDRAVPGAQNGWNVLCQLTSNVQMVFAYQILLSVQTHQMDVLFTRLLNVTLLDSAYQTLLSVPTKLQQTQL